MNSAPICITLQERRMIDQSIRDKFHNLMIHSIKKHSDIVRGYYTYLPELMSKYKKEATSEKDWQHFIPWIKHTVKLIDAGEWEKAFVSYVRKTIFLTETYNSDYSIFTPKEIDCYIGVYKQYYEPSIMTEYVE